MKKILLILFIVLVFIIVFFVLITNSLNKKSANNNTQTTSASLNTTRNPQQTASIKQSFNREIKTIPQDLKAKLNSLNTLLPFQNAEFAVVYSPIVDQYIVQLKTPQGQLAFNQWIQQQGIQDVSTNKNLFIFTQEPIDQYIQNVENIYSSKLNQIHSATPTPDPNQSPTPTPDQTHQDLQQLNDFLNIMMKIPDISSVDVNPSQTPNNFQPSTTINQPSPSINPPSLTLYSLFQEIGQQVGIPPKILEGVLHAETPSTFNLTSDQINQYSQPGAVIPGCRPNECSATGPMQMSIGIDGNGSSSCPQCCWQGKCYGYCPNAWVSYGSGNPCNLRDNITAAARKLKNQSGAVDPNNWTEAQVYKAIKSYYGNCTVTYPRFNNLTYCGYIWNYYQNP